MNNNSNNNTEYVHVRNEGDLVIFSIDNPPVNALSQRMVVPLQQHFKEAVENPNIKGVIITGTGKFFVSGADIKEFSSGDRQGIPIPDWFSVVEASEKPVVIVLNGIALGGGLELAMSGHYRIALPTCRFGLVELRLGLLPGAGGTQRLPRLIGVKRATEIMLNSEEINSDEAYKLGLIDEVVKTPEELIPAAIYAIRNRHVPVRRSLYLSDKLGPLWKEEQFVNKFLSDLDKQGKTRNQIHFSLCADCIVTGIMKGPKAGLKKEFQNFVKCLTSYQSRGLINIFFAQRTSSNVPGLEKVRPKKTIKKVGVLGGGTMGSGIVTWLLLNDAQVTLKEVDGKALAAAKGRIEGNLKESLKKGKITQEKLQQLLTKKLTLVDSWKGFNQLDLVIEAIFEDEQLKRSTFIDLEKNTSKDCILASNTSTISLEKIGEKTHCKDRIIGVHFFAPAHVMPLVEVIRGDETAPETIVSCVTFIKEAKKTVIVVRNCVGFLVNRIFAPVGSVSAFLVNCGMDPYRIDDAMYKFGMAMGPFRTSDLSGIDIGNNAANVIFGAYGKRLIKNTLPVKMIEKGRLGEKTGKGYYIYEGRKAIKDTKELPKIIQEAHQDFLKVFPNVQNLNELKDEEISSLVVATIINEACRTLEEGIAIRASDVDVASVFGMGFPAYRGGVMCHGQTVGFKRIYDLLNGYYQRFNHEFFRPSDYLKKLSEKKAKL